MGLRDFAIDEPLHYAGATGMLHLSSRKRLDRLAQECRDTGNRLAIVCVMPDSVGSGAAKRLRQELAAADCVVPVRLGTLVGTPARNVAAQIAARLGTVICELDHVPATNARTVFVGLDLGHHHRGGHSVEGLQFFNARGKEIDTRRIPCGANDERIPRSLILRDIPALIRKWYRDPSHVIVHRDGRYLAGELEDFARALREFRRHSLVSVKKDSCTRMERERLEGVAFRLSSSRAVLVTNAQGAVRSMPRPLEVELNHAGGLTLDDATLQVLWLSRGYHNGLFHTRRLPVTTARADAVATTGKRRSVRR